MVDYTIENYIVSTEIITDINLKKIASKIENVEYNPESFPGIIFKLNDPRTVTFILKSGRTVCVGGKSFKEAKMALIKVINTFAESGFEIESELDIEVQNIIVSMDLKSRLNLNEIGELLNWQNTTYNSNEFKGLVYGTDLDDVFILLFESGKLVCYGAKKLSEINKVLDKFVSRLHSVGLI
jgi:transcription initiation factor TFIID TATA-box-binding protein